MIVFLYFTSVLFMIYCYGAAAWPFIHVGLYAFLAWVSRRLHRLFVGQKTDDEGNSIPLDGGYWYVGLWTFIGLLGGLYFLGWTVFSVSGGWGWPPSVQVHPKPTVWLALIGLPLLGFLDYFSARLVIRSRNKGLRIIGRMLLFLSLFPVSFVCTPVICLGLWSLYGRLNRLLFDSLSGRVFKGLLYSSAGIYILGILLLLIFAFFLLYLCKRTNEALRMRSFGRLRRR